MTVVALLTLAAGVIGWLAATAEPEGARQRIVLARFAIPLPPATPQSPEAVTTATTQQPPTEAPTTEPVAPTSSPAAAKPPVTSPPAAAKPADSPQTAAIPTPRAAVVKPPSAATPRRTASLTPAPDPALIEQGRDGPLPIIGFDGREAWQVYARPFDLSDKRPKIAIVISGLGLSSAATEAAIQRLPGGVTLSFAPFANNLEQWINLARIAGHEVLLNLPMEPINYPVHDPGPRTLLTSLPDDQNLDRLEWALSRVSGYVGVTNFMGSRFTTASDSLRPILDALKKRGLMFVDSRSSARSVAPGISREINLPHAVNNRFIDNEASRVAIDRRLAEIEGVARSQGYGLAMGFPYPVTIERVAEWAATVEDRGFVIAPVSALGRLELDRKVSAE